MSNKEENCVSLQAWPLFPLFPEGSLRRASQRTWCTRRNGVNLITYHHDRIRVIISIGVKTSNLSGAYPSDGAWLSEPDGRPLSARHPHLQYRQQGALAGRSLSTALRKICLRFCHHSNLAPEGTCVSFISTGIARPERNGSGTTSRDPDLLSI